MAKRNDDDLMVVASTQVRLNLPFLGVRLRFPVSLVAGMPVIERSIGGGPVSRKPALTLVED